MNLHALIADHMVIQRDRPIRLRGRAAAGTTVTASLASTTGEATAAADGRWTLELDALPAGGPYTLEFTADGETTRVHDLLVGDVWICSGQSNMGMAVVSCNDQDVEIDNAQFPHVRMFMLPALNAAEPQLDVQGQWKVCTPGTVGSFSATAYYFGRRLWRELGVPIGLIKTCWGGSPVEAWVPHQTLETDPAYEPILERERTEIAAVDAAHRAYPAAYAEWVEAAAAAEAAGVPNPQPPGAPGDIRRSNYRAAGLYNAMIHPLIYYPVRGCIWYQGESNVGRAEQYSTLFPAMIQDWRAAWNDPDMPFYTVQLANFAARKPLPVESDWAALREAQADALKLPHTGQAVIIDIGDAYDIHPRNKQDVGDRLARIALQDTYGRAIAGTGPRYRSHHIADGRVVVTFDHAVGGLVTSDGEAPRCFALAGADGVFHWATGRIDGDAVILDCGRVTEPRALRYAWADNPDVNLYNAAGLPAEPFRTDRPT